MNAPSPLVGEGSEAGRHKLTWVRGCLREHLCKWTDTPHPALRATFPHKGEGKKHYTVAPCAFGLRKCSSSRGMISTKLQGRVR